MNYNEMEEEVVILDSGSDVSLLPKRHQRNLEGSTLGCRLQNCQGGTLEVAGVRHAEHMFKLEEDKVQCYNIGLWLEMCSHAS